MQLLYNENSRFQDHPQIISSLLSATDEASAVQHLPSSRFRGFGTLNYFQNQKFFEESFKIEEMPIVIADFMKRGGGARDAYISQHAYNRRSRRIESLNTLNLCSVDLDTYASTSNAGELSETALINIILEKCRRYGIAEPSYIVHSGRGLQVKWIFSDPLSGYALTRWQTVQRYLVDNIFFDLGADIKATLPTQIMRMVGSTNTKSGDRKIVRVIWVNNTAGTISKVSFDKFADSVLDYTREEVRIFKEAMRQRDERRNENLENRLKAAAHGFKSRAERESHYKALLSHVKLDMSPTALASIDDMVGGEIWERRRHLMSELVEIRGGTIMQGQGRHDFAWIVANALGWCNRNNLEALKLDTIAWCQSRIPSYSENDILEAASAVLRRAAKSTGLDSKLYEMKETTFSEKLGITDAEWSVLRSKKTSRSGKEVNVGAMGLEKMVGLSFDQWLEETNLRQTKAAKFVNSKKRDSKRDLKKRAKRMLSNGRSVSYIAEQLDVSERTVRNYISN